MSEYIKHIANTIFGMYQVPYSEEWDRELNDIMDSGRVIETSDCTITYLYKGNAMSIWTANRWYAFGHLERVNDSCVGKKFQKRPKFKTMLKLWNAYSTAHDNFQNAEFKKLFN